jgi:hypothetical protein
MEPERDGDSWEALQVPLAEVAGWTALGFGPFGAAMARGDGFTPSFATHYRRQLRHTVNSWARACLDSTEGLRWHRAGFSAKEATRWRSLGVGVDSARSRRDGYGPP